jgi:hypothetical protein
VPRKQPTADVADVVQAIVRKEGKLRRRAGKRESFIITPKRRTIVWVEDVRTRSA